MVPEETIKITDPDILHETKNEAAQNTLDGISTTGETKDRRISLRYHDGQVLGAANRVLREDLYSIKDGIVRVSQDVLRKTEPGRETPGRRMGTTASDSKEFAGEVRDIIQDVIDQGPQNSEYEEAGEDEKRQQYNLGPIGAAIRFIRENLSAYVPEPERIKIPNEFFREGDDSNFKKLTAIYLRKMLEEANLSRPDEIETSVHEIGRRIRSNEKINQLKQLIGEDAYRLSAFFSYLAGLCNNDLPDYVNPANLHHVYDTSLKLADSVLDQITNEETAERVEKAYREALGENHIATHIWEKVKDLHGTKFVKELYKAGGYHIGVQGFNTKDLGAIPWDDLQHVFKGFLGFTSSSFGENLFGNREGTFSKVVKKMDGIFGRTNRENREKNLDPNFGPCVYAMFDGGLGINMGGDEQVAMVKKLNAIINKETDGQTRVRLKPMGVTAILDRAARTAITGKRIGEHIETRLALDGPIRTKESGKPLSKQNPIFATFKYEYPEDFGARKLRFSRTENHPPAEKIDFAFGQEIKLNTLPLGM